MAIVGAESRGAAIVSEDAIAAGSSVAVARVKGSSGAAFNFYMLCGYLLSQAFMIPVRAIGPSWALWPRLAGRRAIHNRIVQPKT